MRTTYFLSRETVIPTRRIGMARWREVRLSIVLLVRMPVVSAFGGGLFLTTAACRHQAEEEIKSMERSRVTEVFMGMPFKNDEDKPSVVRLFRAFSAMKQPSSQAV